MNSQTVKSTTILYRAPDTGEVLVRVENGTVVFRSKDDRRKEYPVPIRQLMEWAAETEPR